MDAGKSAGGADSSVATNGEIRGPPVQSGWILQPISDKGKPPPHEEVGGSHTSREVQRRSCQSRQG